MAKKRKFVYLLKANDTYKIGVTSNSDIKKRISALQTGCPYKIQCIFIISTLNAYEIEARLHRLYSTIRTHGEWFMLEDYHIKEIESFIHKNKDNTFISKDKEDKIIPCRVGDVILFHPSKLVVQREPFNISEVKDLSTKKGKIIKIDKDYISERYEVMYYDGHEYSFNLLERSEITNILTT